MLEENSCSGYSSLCLYFVLLMSVSHLYRDNTGKYMYDRQFLLHIGRSLIYANTSVPVEALKQLGLLYADQLLLRQRLLPLSG